MSAVLATAACGDNILPGAGDATAPTGDGAIADTAVTADAAIDAVVADARPNLACETPMPPVAQNFTLTDNIPSDFDPTASPAPTPTTTIAFTVLLPTRCPGDHFPLILHSHGYGGSRITTVAANGDLHPEDTHFKSIDELTQALPYHGYTVLSFDERGHGGSTDANARIIDPMAETQDARALLDWAYDHADDIFVQRDDASGIAKDVVVGTLGYSYGGGFQLPLALLDSRVDTIVPNGTWHELLYSLMPGDAVKLSFDGLLCLLATTGGVKNTPLVATMCNAIGITGVGAQNDRSRTDLDNSLDGATASPRKVTDSEFASFLDTHSMAYFQRTAAAGATRAMPALFLQGNRDNLFNVTEELWNARYFRSRGGDVRTLSTEGGHMNPLASQIEGTASCGKTQGVVAILAWFDKQLKGIDSAEFDSIPKTCLSVADTANAATATPVAVISDELLVGSQTGTGAIAAKLATGSASLPLLTEQVFIPVVTIPAGTTNAVLAGAPTIGSLTVTAGTLAIQSTNAFIGVGIQRAGSTFLVDENLTGFTAGTHTTNRNVGEDSNVLLPVVGERLQPGDVVGLLVEAENIQYAAVVSASSLPGGPGIVNEVGGTSVPPITSGLNPVTGLTYVNPLSVTVTDVELPIIVPGTFAGTSLSQ